MTVEEIRGRLGGETDRFPVCMRVLAVDDDPTCLMLLDGLLRKCQYQGLILLFYACFFVVFVLLNFSPNWVFGSGLIEVLLMVLDFGPVSLMLKDFVQFNLRNDLS